MNRKHLAVALSALLLSFLPALGVVTKYDADTAHSTSASRSRFSAGSRTSAASSPTSPRRCLRRRRRDEVFGQRRHQDGSIDTGIERRDAHLRTPDFFDAESPETTFQSKRIEKKGNQLIAHGTFTMHGVSKEIALPFTINGVRKDEKTGKTTLGVSARTIIKKSEYGMTWARPDNPTFRGDDVAIELDIVTRAASPGTPAAATAAPAGR